MESSTIPLTNLITNGSFEVNANGWTGFMTNNQGNQGTLTLTTQNILAPGHGEFGTRSAGIGTKTQGVIYMNPTNPIPVIIGHKYYIRARINLRSTTAGVVSGCTVVNTMTVPQRGTILPNPLSEGLQTTNITNWALIDTIWTADTTALNFRVIWQTTANQGNNELYGQIDNVVVIDLTKDFTPGLEPPIFAIRGGVNFSPPNGYWDGTADITMPIPPIIVTETLPLALKGRNYFSQIEIAENTGTREFIFSLDDLPIAHGLSIDSNGFISGILNLDEGSYNFTVQLTDSIGYQISREYTLDVGEPPVILDEFLVNPTYDELYLFEPNVIGSVPIITFITVTSGTLPTGLAIINSTITGTPTVDGQSCQITITAYNKYDEQGVSKVFNLGVYSTPHINNISPLPNATLGSEYSLTFSVSGIKPIYIEYLSDDLPPGLTFEDGKLSGTPTQIGVYSFSIKATNDLGSDTQLFTLTVYEIPVITTTIFGYARLGNAYSGRLTAKGSEPITYSITSGSLPPGLTLNRNTGIISGNPLGSGVFTFTVVASNIVGNSQPKTFVIESGLSLAITTTSPLRNGTVGVPYGNLQLEADGLDYSQVPVQTWSWAAEAGSSLPPGLVLNSTTGIISGTPISAGVYTVHITVVNGLIGAIPPSPSAVSPFTIEIGKPPTITTPTTLAGGVDRPFTVVLQASGPQPITYRMLAPPIPLANIQLDTNGALHWLIPEIGTYNFDVVATNSFGDSVPVKFTLIITTPAIIDVDLDYGIIDEPYLHTFTASGAPPFTWALIGTLPYGLGFDSKTATISGVPTTTGITNFEIRATNVGGFAQELFSIIIYARPIFITSDLNSGNVGFIYSQTLQASGTTPIIYQLIDGTLPPGLDLVGARILGTPSSGTEGVYNFKIRAQNLLGEDFSDIQQFQITILPSGAPIITTGSKLTGTRGIVFELTLNASGEQPIMWGLTDVLPDGLSLNNYTISGTPTTAGIYSFTITATNNYGSDHRTFSMTIGDPPVITKSELADGITNTAYSDTLTADGDSPKTWSVLPPTGNETNLPPGLVLNSTTGVISGVPTVSGAYIFRIRVVNNSGNNTKTFTINISSLGGTFIKGKEIGSLFILGKEVSEAYVNGILIYKNIV